MAVKYCDYASGADFTGQTNWAVGQFYPTNTFLIGKSGGSYTRVVYRCTADHTSANDTEPGVGVDWATVWEVYADGTWDHPYKTITDASTAAGVGANEVRCKASPADTAIGGQWTFARNSTAVICTDGVNRSGEVAAKDIIGNATVGWWEVASAAYNSVTGVTTITLSYAWAHADGRRTATLETIVKRGTTDVSLATGNLHTIQVGGTSPAALFRISGGWIADGVQGDGFSSGQQTTFRNTNVTRSGTFVDANSKNYLLLEKLHAGRFGVGLNMFSTGSVIKHCNFTGIWDILRNLFLSLISDCNFYYGSFGYSTLRGCILRNVFLTAGKYRGENLLLENCSARLSPVWITLYGNVKCRNCNIDSATRAEFGSEFHALAPVPLHLELQSYNDNGVSGSHRVDTYTGYYVSQTTRRHTESGIAWTMYPNSYSQEPSASGTNYGVPLELSIAQVAVAANAQVTATVWVAKSNAASTFEARLICKGGQLAGVSSDVTDVADDTTDWQQLQVQCTPTEAGVLEFHVQVWGSSSYYVDVDDFAVSQA